MSDKIPNFRRGAPPMAAPTGPTTSASPKPKAWVAKFSGTCELCRCSINAGEDRVQWNEEGTAVVCAHHRLSS